MVISEVDVRAGPVVLAGDVSVPDDARGLVIFAHGSGSSRRSPRNREVAGRLQQDGFATLLFDLLTPEEEALDLDTATLRFDIGLLAERITGTVRSVRYGQLGDRLAALPVGLFGASTGAAAALVAAAGDGNEDGIVRAVVSRGGRPDLAGTPALTAVRAPTLLIVGGRDVEVLSLNERAAAVMTCQTEMLVVAKAGHLFAEPGALKVVTEAASRWFERYLG